MYAILKAMTTGLYTTGLKEKIMYNIIVKEILNGNKISLPYAIRKTRGLKTRMPNNLPEADDNE